jgi:hypothetical protein
MPLQHRHDLLREGIITGLVGALAVAGWFLIIDVIQGRLFATPSVLGQVILFNNPNPVITPVQAGPIVAYTLLHVGAFIGFGIAVTHLVHLAMYSPLVRFALMIVAVVFELFFFMVTYALFTGTSNIFPWWSVLAANTLSLAAMSVYLMRRHPGLKRQYQREPLGA